jgi:hypothetical protein
MCGSNQVGPTETQKTQADINTKMYAYYKENYKPLVDRYAASAIDPATIAAENKKVTGEINADLMKGAKPVSTNPASNVKNMINLSDAKARSEVAGKAGEKERQLGKELNVISIGRGQTTKAMQGLDVLAGQSVEEAIQNKEMDMQDQAIMENSIGSAVGLAAGAGLGYYMKSKGKNVTVSNNATNDQTITP